MPKSSYSLDQIAERRQHADALFSRFSAYHESVVGEVRSMTRRSLKPDKGSSDNQLVKPIRSAHAYAILRQITSYIVAEPKFSVPALVNTRQEDDTVQTLEKWLNAIAATLRPRSGNPIGKAEWHLCESGLMVLHAVFEPALAAMGEFPFVIREIDPIGFAFSRSAFGLNAAVTSQEFLAGELFDELRDHFDKSLKPAWTIPPEFEINARKHPFEPVTVIQYWTKDAVSMWIDEEHVKTQKHFCGRVPFFVGTFGIPSDKPEDQATGLISPVIDALDNEEWIFSLYSDNAEYGFRPLVAVFDGAQWQIKQALPGESFSAAPGSPLVPFPAQPNPQMFELLNQRGQTDIEQATIPSVQFKGDAAGASGFAISQVAAPSTSRVDDLRAVPESVLEELGSYLLAQVKFWATPEMARQWAKGDPEKWNSAFAVNVAINPKKQTKRKQFGSISIDAEVVGDHSVVRCSLKPNLPQDMNAKLQRCQLAAQIGIPFEEVIRNEQLFSAENPDEILDQFELQRVRTTNPIVDQFLTQYEWKKRLEENRDLRKAWMEFTQANGIDPQTGEPAPAPQPDMGMFGGGPSPIQPPGPALPPELAQDPSLLGPGGPMMPPDGGMSIPGAGLPGNAPPEMFGQQPTPEMLAAMAGGSPPFGG